MLFRSYGEWLIRARRAIVDSGIAFGYGTDFVAQHACYENGYEYETLLRSGVDPFRALAAATRVNAKTLGMDPEMGGREKSCSYHAGRRKPLLRRSSGYT